MIWVAMAVLTAAAPMAAADSRVRVTDMDRQPVDRAMVRLGTQQLTVGADGVASFVGLPAGKQTLAVAGPDFGKGTWTVNVVDGGANQFTVRFSPLIMDEVPNVEQELAVATDAALRGALRVTVLDASNAVIPGAAVTVSCDGVVRTAPSDASGVAVFSGLPLGECSIAVERTAFKAWRGKGLAAAGDGGIVEARLDVILFIDSVPVKPKSAGRRFVDWLTSCKPR